VTREVLQRLRHGRQADDPAKALREATQFKCR
jgi:hypothetical protein